MLSAVLHSKTAIKVSIAIMEAFIAMRHYLIDNAGLINRLSNVEAKDLEQDQRLLAHDRKLDEVFVCGLIRQAKKRFVLIDNYVDEKTLAMMLKRNEGVSVTIYTYNKSKVFEVDLSTYNAQYADTPIEILPSDGVHDRFLFIDDTAYHFGASLKDLGKNTFFFSKEDFTLEEVLKK